MAESNFVDYVKILCRSGKGGAGAMHLYRAKYVPKGVALGLDVHLVRLTAVTAVGEEMFIYELTVICGLCCI